METVHFEDSEESDQSDEDDSDDDDGNYPNPNNAVQQDNHKPNDAVKQDNHKLDKKDHKEADVVHRGIGI